MVVLYGHPLFLTQIHSIIAELIQNLPGPRHPLLLHPYKNPPHLLRREIPNSRPPIQSRKRVDRVLRNGFSYPPIRGLPRFLGGNGRADG